MKWQPIETAPRDAFLLVNSDEGMYVAWMHSSGWFQYSRDEFVDAPTHWMPLPEPPDA